MKDNHNRTCELIQLSISDAIDANAKISNTDDQHIQNCTECADFFKLWNTESNIPVIASGSLIEQEDLMEPIISHLEEHDKVVRGRFPQVLTPTVFTSIAAVAAIAIISIFTFSTAKQDLPASGDPTIFADAHIEKPIWNIPKIEINLTEINLAEINIEKSLEKNYHQLSNVAKDKWKTSTQGVAFTTEYIANGLTYISTKYLTPPNGKKFPSEPQSELAPERDAPDLLQYG